MEFFDTIRQVKTNWNPYKKWELEQQKKEKQNEELIKKYPPTPEELKHAKQYGRTIVDVINIMDQHSIDKSEDAGITAGYTLLPFSIVSMIIGGGLGSLFGRIVNKSKSAAKFADLKPYWMPIGLLAVNAITMPIINIWLAKITKQASRVARFQTRENELKNPRSFVIYDEQQTNEAEKIAKTLPEIKEDRQDKFTKDTFNPIESYKKTKRTTDELKKDDEKYQDWEKEYLKEEAQKKEIFKTITPSKDELGKAEKDRDVLLNTIKKIENKALEYYNNMEMASYVINAAVSGASLLIGGGIYGLINLLQKNNTALKGNKSLNAVKGTPVILSVIAPIIVLAPINKLIKNAARIGRFKAKQELLSNPQNFIAYDEEQRKTVILENLTEKKYKGLLIRFKEDIKAIKQLQNDAKEYKDYMNTTHKEELKINEALKQIKITDKQESNAVQLQKKAFHSFEKMDEMAQRYTDDTDAAIDSTRFVLGSIISLVVRLLPVYFCGKELKAINNNKVPENIGKVLKLTFFSGKLKGKTLAIMLAPFILPKLIAILMAIKGVQIKKDAGKIGVMAAMNDLSDPKNFLDKKKI